MHFYSATTNLNFKTHTAPASIQAILENTLVLRAELSEKKKRSERKRAKERLEVDVVVGSTGKRRRLHNFYWILCFKKGSYILASASLPVTATPGGCCYATLSLHLSWKILQLFSQSRLSFLLNPNPIFHRIIPLSSSGRRSSNSERAPLAI